MDTHAVVTNTDHSKSRSQFVFVENWILYIETRSS